MPASGASDTELIERCLKGDAEAWEALVGRYRRLVYSVPIKMALKPEDVDEVFQESFRALLEKLGTLKDRERVGLWMAVTARRKALDCVRRRTAAREVVMPEGFEAEDPAHLPLYSLIRLERQAAVRAAWEGLDARCRTLLEGLFYQDPPASYQELAAKLGLKPGALGPQRQRCFARLRRILEGHRGS